MKKIKVLTSFYYDDFPYQAGQIYDLDDEMADRLELDKRIKIISTLTDSEIEIAIGDGIEIPREVIEKSVDAYLSENPVTVTENDINELKLTKMNGEVEVTNYMLLVETIEGKLYNASGNLVTDANNHSTTLTKLDRNKNIYCGGKYTSYVVFFDENKNFISRVTFYDGVPVLKDSFPSNAIYVAFSYYKTGYLADKMYISTLNTQDRRFGYSSIIKYKNVRPVINIYLTDTQEEILKKFMNAFYTGNCDVQFEKGTYILDDVHRILANTHKWTDSNELLIGNDCRYYFNGSTIIDKSTEDTYYVHSVFGTHRFKDAGNFELHDGIIICQDGVYCVHDEANNSTIPYIRKFVNMKMEYISGSHTNTSISKCIGGGLGLYSTIIIENCVFKNDNTNENVEDVSYHGHELSSETSGSLSVYNSFFGRTIGLHNLGENEQMQCVFNNNRTSKNIVKSSNNWEILSWNNIIESN